MNRVIFLIAFIILLCVPFSINTGNEESFRYLEIVKNLKDEIISVVIKTETTTSSKLAFSEEDKLLFNKKYEEFKIAEALNLEYLIASYDEESVANNKNLNKYLAKFKWLSLKEKEGGVKGIYLNGYDFTNKNKIQ